MSNLYKASGASWTGWFLLLLLDPPALEEEEKKKNMAPTRSCIGFFACKMRAPDTEPKVWELRLTGYHSEEIRIRVVGFWILMKPRNWTKDFLRDNLVMFVRELIQGGKAPKQRGGGRNNVNNHPGVSESVCVCVVCSYLLSLQKAKFNSKKIMLNKFWGFVFSSEFSGCKPGPCIIPI